MAIPYWTANIFGMSIWASNHQIYFLPILFTRILMFWLFPEAGLPTTGVGMPGSWIWSEELWREGRWLQPSAMERGCSAQQKFSRERNSLALSPSKMMSWTLGRYLISYHTLKNTHAPKIKFLYVTDDYCSAAGSMKIPLSWSMEIW